uniref:serine hydrolase domain-containing protein n=1 Tax=Marisediminitalea sp. TaxID=2662268 RepID=UPI0035144F91
MNKLLSSLLLFIVTTSAYAFDRAKLDAYLETIEANDKAMLSLAITKDGKPVYQRAIGLADIACQKKANTDTLYRIGSITKVFTSVMIFQLIDEGKLSLTTPLAQF